MSSRNAKKGAALVGGRSIDAGIDLQIPDASEDVERCAEGRHGRDEEVQSTVSGERSAGTTLSGSGAGGFWYGTRSRGWDHVKRKRQRKQQRQLDRVAGEKNQQKRVARFILKNLFYIARSVFLFCFFYLAQAEKNGEVRQTGNDP